MKSFKATLKSVERVLPVSRAATLSQGALHHPLSLCDAKCVGYAPAGGLWFFDPPHRSSNRRVPSTQHIKEALQITLNSYRPWTGHFRRRLHRPDGGRYQYGRLEMLYNTPSDPGIVFEVARCNAPVSSLVPSIQDRRQNNLTIGWHHNIPRHNLYPDGPLANPLAEQTDANLSNSTAMFRITECEDGGMVLSVKMSHGLADGVTEAMFLRSWAQVTRALASNTAPPRIDVESSTIPVDSVAGDIDSPEPNAGLLGRAGRLPMLRLDTWHSPTPFAPDASPIPTGLQSNPRASKPAGDTAVPWSDWNPAAEVHYETIHFGPDQIQQIVDTTSTNLPAEAKLSVHDSMVSHLWSCINRARGFTDSDETVSVHMGISIRPRMTPPLGGTYTGSPVLLGNLAMKGRDVASAATMGDLATRIRSVVRAFDHDGIAAELHATAYELSPQRVWNAFFGHKHLISTSSVRSGHYDVDFGFAFPPRYVEPLLPMVDGILVMLGAPPPVPMDSSQSRLLYGTKHGIDVSVTLSKEAMGRLLSDPLLLP